MATSPFPFHDSWWNIEYHAACVEKVDSLRLVAVRRAVSICSEALEYALSAEGGTKRVRFHVPEPQRERIIKKFISGVGVRQISREENRTRSTVSRIIRSSEVQKSLKIGEVHDLR